MRPLRVLHVTPYYENAWGYGGIPRVAATTCRALVKRGHQVSVATTDVVDGRRRQDPSRRFTAWRTRGRGGVEVNVFPNLSNRLAYGRQFFTPVGLSRFLSARVGQTDVAHLHGFHHLPGVLASRALRRAGIPYVLTPNGVAPCAEGQRLAKWCFNRAIGRGVMSGAERIIAVSPAEQRQLEAMGICDGVSRLVPNPIDLDEFVPPPTPAVAAPVDGWSRTIAYLGTLLPRKGVDVLVRALAYLSGEVGLVIAGNDLGAGARVRRTVQRLGLQDRVRFAGLLVGRRRLELLAAADVVAYPGRAEVFGLVPLEAILCGTPVVVANDSGCGEVIDQLGGGLAVPPDNPRALAAALDHLLLDRQRWGAETRRAADRIRARYSADSVAAALEQLYRDLLRGRERSGAWPA